MVGIRAILLVFLALGVEGVRTLASPQDCDASSDVVVQGGSVVPVYYEVIAGAKKMSATLFLQPLIGFEGVSVEASFATDTLAAWFPTDHCCAETPHDVTWIPLKVEVEVVRHYTRILPFYYLQYMMDFGGCVKKCEKNWDFKLDVVGNLKVVAHGSSRWKCSSPPDACLTSCSNTTITTCQEPSRQLTVNSSSLSFPCNATPSPAPKPTLTTITPTRTVTPTSPALSFAAVTTDDKYHTSLPSTLMVTVSQVLVVVDIVVVVAVLVALFPEMRRSRVLRLRRLPAPLPSPSRQQHQSSVHVSMNSLYESFSSPSESRHQQ
ncbi:uncharacterized protein LOC135103484 isoform X2 [Scylla paramamosain]|uniref:uncharacterized protein LOC135103484 isoform X2 n=1 Tax=Scylla paramamosain TaxID=85552 RepID=UPI003082EB91